MDQYIGKLLDKRYEILERIGSGGMAVVYKAKCHWLNRFVAIKILKEDLAQDAEFRRRFHEESQAIAMLSHPNIVAVYDVSQSPELDYIVMELIDGITLKQYMQKRGGKLSWKEALHFITQIMKGLSHAHSRGIIHRDIKPHNIMVLRDGSVKVADFGIARLASSNQNTMTQEALGSVHYISPEQARGSRIDARSDIYSAGVVLYEMLTGRLPYEGDSPVAVAIQHINSIPLSPRELDPSIPEALEAITMKAMASDLDKRYVSADAMLADLEEFRKNPNISFDFTPADLLSEGEDEPTQVLGANSTQVVTPKPAHTSRRDERWEEDGEGDDDYYDDDGAGKRTIVIAAALLVCLVGVGFFLWRTVFSGMTAQPETYIVPDLSGYTLEEARLLPDVVDNGFTVTEGEYVLSETVEAGKIVSQDPEKDTEVKSGGREITVEISAGNGGIIMPDVYNKDQRTGIDMLQALGLQVKVEEAASDTITKGNIIEQHPDVGAPVEKGQEVTVVVSLGPDVKQVPMIPVTGMTLEEATRIITQQLKLRIGEVGSASSDKYEKGLVCYQSIAPNTSVPEDTVINLKVSTGPEEEPTPTPTETAEATPPVEETSEPTPPPQESTEPTAAPSTAPQPTLQSKEITIPLPADRDTVAIQVTVDGVAQFSEPQVVDTRLRTFRCTIRGTGTQQVVVYQDDQQTESFPMNFSK